MIECERTFETGVHFQIDIVLFPPEIAALPIKLFQISPFTPRLFPVAFRIAGASTPFSSITQTRFNSEGRKPIGYAFLGAEISI
ncbi:hypothetical protein TNCV_3416651 [Trichonephila clavipes]|nr:hypothetical protein TNCV_3416651 [Trichonephila clavipes]